MSKTPSDLLQNAEIKKILESIYEQYGFQNEKELQDLLQGMANPLTKGVTYWDYIEVDTLLSLQKPKTKYPDEVIFITYHQICELYFKLIIQELERFNDFYAEEEDDHFHKVPHYAMERDMNRKIVGSHIAGEAEIWTICFERINRYWKNLIFSFDILKNGLSQAEFKEFRKALLPASGFQTYQFRKIEIMLTTLKNLTIPKSGNTKDMYWRKGAMKKMDTSKASKLLKNFNDKYDPIFFELVNTYNERTVLDRYNHLDEEIKPGVRPLLEETENLMLLWKIAHMHMIFEHIPKDAGATGGTDYLNYLPQLVKQDEKVIEPNHLQQVVYFPDFWKERNVHEYILDQISNYLPGMVLKTIKDLYSGNNPAQVKGT